MLGFTFTSVLPLLAARTEEAGMEDKVRAEPRLFEFPLAVEVCQDGQVNLLEHVLVSSAFAKCILAPSTDPASFASKILQNIMVTQCCHRRVASSSFHLESIGQTNGGNVSIAGKVHEAINSDHGEVIVQVAGVVVGVYLHAQDVKLHVGEELAVVVHVPLAQPHPELLWPDSNKVSILDS